MISSRMSGRLRVMDAWNNDADCGHDFPTKIRMETYDFIDKALKHVPVRIKNIDRTK
jgi:hypothetical protein